MHLSLQKLLAERLGIERPNAMQEAVWASSSRKLIALSPTGSGKTGAFGAALVKRLNSPKTGVQGLILAPTRELVLQISDVIRKLAADYKVTALYGKHKMSDEEQSLTVTPDIIAATPGRLLDHIERGSVDLSKVHSLIIDEFDKCLELGFTDQMRKICKHLKSDIDVILTSATPLKDIPNFLNLDDAEIIDFTENKKNHNIHIARVESHSRDKYQTLVDLLRSLPNGKAIVFVNHRESAERLYSLLKAEHLPVGLYHGGLEQVDRERAVIQIENSTTPIMIATDLAARGLDITAIDNVIHYHMPPSAEAWTHRNGRTARVDASGNIFVITSEADNLPEFVVWDSEYNPGEPNKDPIRPSGATLHINAGRKEKISRGDIVGFLINNIGLTAAEIGKIDLRDHVAYVAVPRKALPLIAALDSPKIKGKRVRITPFL